MNRRYFLSNGYGKRLQEKAVFWVMDTGKKVGNGFEKC